MTGVAVFPPPRRRGRARWVGRSTILQPHSPEWLKNLVLTVSFLGLQLIWACEMAQASPYLLSLGLSKSMMAIVFLAGPLSGLIVQPLVGVLSDGCRSSLGRRRPFIIGGCIVSSFSVLLLGWSKEVAGWFTTTGSKAHGEVTIGFAVLAVYIIDFSINVVQASDRSLLIDVTPPDLQPAANAWASRMFGIGAVLGYYVGGIDLVYYTGGYLGGEQLKVLTFFTAVLMCACHAVTVFFVKERVLISREDDAVFEAGGSSTKKALLDIWITFRTLPRPIQAVLDVQFASWVGWFPVLFFSTTWVAEIYAQTHYGNSDLSAAPFELRELATRAGTRAMLFHSIVALVTSIFLPALVAPFSETSPATTDSYRQPPFPSAWNDLVKRLEPFTPTIPLSWLSLSLLWTLSNGIFSALLLATWFATSVGGASTIIAMAGFCWAVTNWAPFALLGDLILRIDSPTNLVLDSDTGDWLTPLSPIAEENARENAKHPQSSFEKESIATSQTTDTVSIYGTPPDTHYPTFPSHSAPRSPSPADAFFDTSMETPLASSRPFSRSSSPALRSHKKAKSKSSHPYGGSSAIIYPPDHQGHFVAPFGSNTSLENNDHDPYYSGSNSTLRVDDARNRTLLIRHSDSFDLSGDEVEDLRRGSALSSRSSFANGGGSGNNSRKTSGLAVGGGDISPGEESDERRYDTYGEESGSEWESEKDPTDEGEGIGDQAGVILGCHNIYLVLPQFLVTALSSIIFAFFAPHHSVIGAGEVPNAPPSIDATDTLASIGDLSRRAMEGEWDALGMIFRIGGVSVAISTYIAWKMTRERERDRIRRLRGTG